MISVIVPVYKNAANIAPLLEALTALRDKLSAPLEVVFVVDGSPDDSARELARRLPSATFSSQLLSLSRNFGSYAAIRAGLDAARGERFCVMAADLQEPPELCIEFDRLLGADSCDVVFGQRVSRNDPWSAKLASALFWGFYRRFIEPDVPPGGVDIFGCNVTVRDQILRLRETNSSLIGQLFWIGYRRAAVPYERRKREIGISAWTLNKKLRYLMDSVFSFSDLPIRLLTRVGVLGLLVALLFSPVVMVARLTGAIVVPGYAATVLTAIFFGALNCLGLGIIGNYVWRAFENTKGRPNFLVAAQTKFEPSEAKRPRAMHE